MRHFRVQQPTDEHGAPDQMKRSPDVVIGCTLLGITAPLMLRGRPSNQGGKPGADFGQGDLHRPWRPPLSDAEVPDSGVRSGPYIADLGREDDAARRSPSIYAYPKLSTGSQCHAW